MTDSNDSSKLAQSSRPRLGSRPFVGGRAPSSAPASPASSPSSALSRPFSPGQSGQAYATATATSQMVVDAAPDTWAGGAPTAPKDESLDQVRARLDNELSHFQMQDEERPRTETPFPALDVAPNNSDHPLARGTVLAGEGVGDAAPMHDIGVRDPRDAEFGSVRGASASTSGIDIDDASEALRHAVAEASRVADGAAAADTLESVARRVRSGDIIVPHGAATGDEAAVLASVLASLLA